MNSSELYDAFRSDVVDIAKPYLWSDDEVFRYMADAHSMFVRLTGGIADITSDATKVDIVAGEAESTLHPSILRIMSARLASGYQEVKVINMTDLQSYSQTDYGAVRQITLDDQMGDVRFMIIGQQKGVCRWVSVPALDDTALLHIYRIPLTVATGPDMEFTDVADEHHIHLLDWMEHLAYKKQDAEAFDTARSDRKASDFKTYCSFVRSEWERYKHKNRVVAYGGI